MCPPGYKQYGDRCLDIDECVEQQVHSTLYGYKGLSINDLFMKRVSGVVFLIIIIFS